MKARNIAAMLFIALLVAVALVVALGIPAGFLVAAVSDRIEADTGYRIRVTGHSKLTVWPALAFVARDIAVRGVGDVHPADPFTAQSLQISLVPASLLSGHPQISGIAIAHPVLRVPLLRERASMPVAATPVGRVGGRDAAAAIGIKVDRVIVTDGTIEFASQTDSIKSRVEHIEFVAQFAGSEAVFDAHARWDDRPVRLSLKATPLADGLVGQSIPIEFAFEAPDLLAQPLTGAANVRVKGSVLAINGLAGAIGPDRFDGWAAVDFTTKPSIKADFDFRRLAVAIASAPSNPSSKSTANSGTAGRAAEPRAPWPDQEVHLDGLNFFDADVQISAAEFTIDAFRMAPIALHATLGRGVVQAALSGVGLYDGAAAGTLGLDASGKTPICTMHVNLKDVRALPLLSDVADFQALDGRLGAAIEVQATGSSLPAAIASLNGAVEFLLRDGEVRGINVAKMIRALVAAPLSGWRESATEKTDFTEFNALFRINGGQASTENLRLAGPLVRVSGAGSADLVNRTLQFRLDPKLVMSLEGQGGATDPVGLGVPVIVQGSWNEPRIYPDIAGILENPDAAYAKLRAIGQGLFGREHGGGVLDTFLQGVGTFLNTPKGDRNDARPASPSSRQTDTQNAPDQAREFLRNFLGR